MVSYFLLIIALLASPSFANIFGKDNRAQKDPNDPSLPFLKSIGIVVVEKANSYGTAWIVKDPKNSGCFVATNYHVGFASSIDPTSGNITVTRAKVGAEVLFLIGADIHRPGFFAEKIPARAVDFGVYNSRDWFGRRDDWAVFKLDQCLGEKYGGLAYSRPIEKIPMPKGELIAAGYPVSKKKTGGVSVEIGCKARDHGPIFGLIGVDCAFESGMSGGPILAKKKNGEWVVAAIISTTLWDSAKIIPRYDADYRNQAVYMSAFFRDLDKITGNEPYPDDDE